MYMIKKVTGTRFPDDVKHKPLRPPVSKNPRMPSPHRYSENEDEMETKEEREEQQQPQQHGAAQGATGLTGQGLDNTAAGAGLHPNQEIDKSICWHVQEPERCRG